MPAAPKLPLLSLALAAVFSSACSEEPAPVTPPRPVVPTPPPRPAPTTMTADFRAVFGADARSRSVYMPTRDPDWSRRILLGPNIVFEASRTSLGEATVVGPEAAAPAPDQRDALGAPIDIALSSRLLGYLAGKGSTLIPLAASRRWSPEWWCARESCGSMTWVERVLLAPRARPGGAKDAARVEMRTDELPTAALAVRSLGRGTIRADVIAQDEGTTLTYRFRRSPSDASICPPVSFDVPVLVFEAEIVSVRDGRLLARIEEARQIVIPAQAAAEIEAFVPTENPEAVAALRQVAEAASRGQWNGALPATPYWLRADVRCKNGEDAFRRLAQQITSQAEAEQEAAAAQMFTKALDPLFAAPADDGKAAKAKPKGAGAKPR